MEHSIGNSKDIIVGTNKGKIGANNVINISGEFNLCTLVVVDEVFQFLQLA